MQNSAPQGMFARYTGEQVQQIPPGFMEAAQAQAQMYASIGQNIANGLYKMKRIWTQRG